jgi:hypothetical protein
MGGRSPSEGTSDRDPNDAPSPGDSSASRPDADDEASAGRDEDPWVRAIEALTSRSDPVPEEVLEAARRALKARRDEPPVAPGRAGTPDER